MREGPSGEIVRAAGETCSPLELAPMSYLVLARKYRPRNFTEMVGQDHVVKALVNALTTQRLHHAYLFTGTRGIGKTTVARILAKYCLLYTSDAADDLLCVDLGGRRI